ncbi:MAG: hypothetical protein PVJ28_11245, partial [Acidimicrobiia bacterium]
AVLAVLGAPLWWAAYQERKRTTLRNFAIGASGIAFVSAAMAAISERQIAQCEAAGNTACIDYGTTGLQVVMVFFFAVGAWWSAYSIWKS